jgi:hypothetical protein
VERLERRAATGERFASRLRQGDLHPGRHSLQRTHWLFPLVVEDPEALILGLPPQARAGCEPGYKQHRRRRSASRAFVASRSFAYDVRRRVPVRVSGASFASLRCHGRTRQRLCSPRSGRKRGAVMGWPRERTLEELGLGMFDVLVIGGRIVGGRVAFDAARAGLRMALVDAGDFGGATSGASARLVHGGLRYLGTGDFRLVRTALRVRHILASRVAPPTGRTVAGSCRRLPGRRTAPLRRALRGQDPPRYHRTGVLRRPCQRGCGARGHHLPPGDSQSVPAPRDAPWREGPRGFRGTARLTAKPSLLDLSGR